MLPQLSGLQSQISRRGGWCLILWSLALFGLPTWSARAQSQDVKSGTKPIGAAKPAAQGAPAVVPSESTAVEFFPELSRKEQEIIRKLEMPATIDSTDEPLWGVRETIMEKYGFSIIIDKVKLEESGIAADAPDITLQVFEIPLRSALRLILRQKNLTFVIEDDVMKITTAAACEADRITRTYPVHDLVDGSAIDFPALMEAIRQGVTPGSWREGADLGYGSGAAYSPPGGAGGSSPPSLAPPTSSKPSGAKAPDLQNTISMVPASGSLVIRQSSRGHDEVLTLLRALRKAKARAPMP